MKICQIMICKGFGGAERAFVDNCTSLAECGHSLLAIIDRGAKSQEALAANQIAYKIIPLRFRQNPFAKRQLKHILLSFQPDVVHAHLRRSMDFAGSVVGKLGFPLVASVHNYNAINTYASADRIIALTEGHRDHILNSNLALENKTCVIQNFSRLDAKQYILTGKQPTRLLSYGRFVHKKGFDVLINAFAKLCLQNNNALLNIVGDGPLRDDINSLIVQHGLQNKVHLLPWSNDVQTLLDQHDIFILPSRKEPFGIALLEAMARGKLIISTRSEGPRQFLDDDTALFCDPDDVEGLSQQMAYALDNLQELQAMADRANLRYRQQFTKEVVTPLIEDCYRSLL